MQKITSFQFVFISRHLIKWTILAIPVAVITGSLVALFLWLLDVVTATRWKNDWLIFLLPFAGIAIHFLYKYLGKDAEAGNNLIVNEIHQPGGGVPAKMAPLVLITTLITHLFGGSAGREGTAVQMGGSISSLLSRFFTLNKQDVQTILMMGIAAGFGAVFGTPVAGAVFALEVLAIGIIRYNALIACLIASVLADITCSSWKIVHTTYSISFIRSDVFQIPFIHFDFILLIKVILSSICFGITAFLFSWLQQNIKNVSNSLITTKWLIPFTGGLIIIALCYLTGTKDYLGLGVVSESARGVSILSSFKPGGANYLSWFYKLLFTAITLGTGFKGGEVTPLFFIGAALGNTLATISGAPVDLFAGIGFIAVFAAATNTPLACTIMGVELFGGSNIVYFAIACFTAYYFSGHSGIYSTQRIEVRKGANGSN